MAKWDFRSDDEGQYVGSGPYGAKERGKSDQLNLDLDDTAQYGQWKSEELYNSYIYPNVTFSPDTVPKVTSWTIKDGTTPLVDWKINTGTPPTKFKFNENVYIREADLYIQDTYKQHYGQGQYQATDMIIDAGHGEAFCVGNIMKYAMRYGKKNGYDRKDLLKIVHYAIIALHCLDNKNADTTKN